jgi:isopentenyl phosphate kinase
MREIAESKLKRIVLIHGGGSFGHPVARQYSLQDGLRQHSQILGLAQTRRAMMELNKIVVDAGLSQGLPCVSVAPSSFVQTENKRIVEMPMGIIRSLLSLGAIPVLHGDVVLDEKIGFCVLSGDQLAARIATELGSRKVVLAIDVDGVYETDPKLNSEAKIIPLLDLDKAKELTSLKKDSGEGDVTGGMAGKISEMMPVVERGGMAIFINGRRPGNLLRVLAGKADVGTVMKRRQPP